MSGDIPPHKVTIVESICRIAAFHACHLEGRLADALQMLWGLATHPEFESILKNK